MQAGGLGGSVQAELGHLGERAVLLGNQTRGASVPGVSRLLEVGQARVFGYGGDPGRGAAPSWWTG